MINAKISSENEQFIQQEITAGRYTSADGVVNAGLEMLRKRQDLLSRIDESRRQLDEGEYTEYDEDGLRRRFDELQERIDRKAAEKHAARQ